MINSALLLLVIAQPLSAILFNLDFELPPPIVHQLPPEPPGCCSPIQCAFANSKPPCPIGGAGGGGGGG
ncbi:unnamed protein product [Cylicocyclus nassatus]|uniref:Uncharacterized protein n=1 Tax=Cylicocyclus nassatus TaxID=53992 RepID=A0AA36DVM2_CYLNA|nr:unnamed protein product [Cylicocyclus nassatus]